MNLNQYIEHLQQIVADNPDDGLLPVYHHADNREIHECFLATTHYSRLTTQRGLLALLDPDDPAHDEMIQAGIALYSE